MEKGRGWIQERTLVSSTLEITYKRRIQQKTRSSWASRRKTRKIVILKFSFNKQNTPLSCKANIYVFIKANIYVFTKT